MLKTAVALASALALVASTVGCGSGSGSSSGAGSGRVKVAAAFYPLADAAQAVGGDRVHVTNLTPPGAEPHDLELTPKSVDEVLDARLAVVMGHGFQPAVEDAVKQRPGGTVVVLDRLPIGAGDRKVEEGNPNALDPHVWLDPTLMGRIVTLVRDALVKADASHAAEYRANAATFEHQLAQLDSEFRAGLTNCRLHEIITSHEAFAYLAKRYGLKQLGIAGISPDQEPSPDRIAELTDLVRRDHVKVIFTEDFVSRRVADTLAREAGGVQTEVLSPLEGLTKQQQAARDDYLSVMRSNLRKLRGALDCA